MTERLPGKPRNDRLRLRFVPATMLWPEPYRPFPETLGAWHWLVRKLHEHAPKGTPYEWLNGTGSINNCEPYAVGSCSELARRMTLLFRHAGKDNGPGRFLAESLGIRDATDLGRPIDCRVRTNPDFPDPAWFRMRGRTFKRSPNSCHEAATWVMGASLKLCWKLERWGLDIEYGYPRKSSSWFERIRQEPGERLGAFVARANRTIEDWLERDTDRYRLHREEERDRKVSAIRELFWDNFDLGDWQDDMTDCLMRVPGGSLSEGRFRLTKRRLRTLKEWAEASRQGEGR